MITTAKKAQLSVPSHHDFFMAAALREAERAWRRDEVPVGAVLVKDNRIVARGHNLTKTRKSPLWHAEMVVLEKYARKIKNERFSGVTLYVTLEPCAMCAGAIVQARIGGVVYGCRDPKAGACGSIMDILPNRRLNHRPIVLGGVKDEESAAFLTAFFREKRKAILKKVL